MPRALVRDFDYHHRAAMGTLAGLAERKRPSEDGAVLIRDYVQADERAIVALWERVFDYAEARNTPERVLRDKVAWDGRLLVAVVQGAVVGTLMFGFDGHRGWLYRLAVEERARRRGIGRSLVAAAEERLVELGCVKINLQSHGYNASGARFWKAVGYDEEERVSLGKDLTVAFAALERGQ